MERKINNDMRSKTATSTNITDTIVNNSSNQKSSSSNSTMRKPLSDLTNFNLIPTARLREFISSNSVPDSEIQYLLQKSQTPIKPSCRKLPQNSVASKPYNNPLSHTGSDLSIGSSNVNNDPNGNARNPPPVRHQLPRSSSAISGGDGSELIMYSRRRDVENVKGQRKTDVLLNSSTPVEKSKNERKAVSVPSSSTPAEKAKHKGKAAAVPFDSNTSGKTIDKGKAIATSYDSIPAANASDKGKKISAHFRSSDVENTREKGKAIAVPINCTHEEVEGKGKSTAVLVSGRPTKKKKEKSEDAMVSSCPPLFGKRNARNELNQAGEVTPLKSWTDPHRKLKKRKRAEQQSASEYALSPEFKQLKAYFDEVDAFELPVEEVSYDDSD